MGFRGAGGNILIEGNEISHNNYAGFDPFWGGGGSKWVYTSHLIVRGNYSHDNLGPGLWTDINNIHTLYPSFRTSAVQLFAGLFANRVMDFLMAVHSRERGLGIV
jgi:hypothetical protein